MKKCLICNNETKKPLAADETELGMLCRENEELKRAIDLQKDTIDNLLNSIKKPQSNPFNVGDEINIFTTDCNNDADIIKAKIDIIFPSGSMRCTSEQVRYYHGVSSEGNELFVHYKQCELINSNK